ncbi:HAD family hydrolase [Magnetovibrio blakemorei]|uniref:phosphoglycolate phosphatase n=1 Tax=Magnetovibrio blakemorei TaxID=28181 RepID=A0A1E5Q4C6_9PROT|nr:HAD-IA family hydrolase [Magnetovibrio blakemorei]OEJ64634.1 HAD family hydrolase [Magnetovibrio blakemorei]
MNAPAFAHPKAIIFDWDNTLVDSWVVIQDALNTTFRQFDVPEWTFEETKTRVAKSMRDSFPEIFGDQWEAAGKAFYAHFESIHLERLTPLLGAAEMLAQLDARGIYLGVVSNKTGNLLRAEAQQLGWDRHFGQIIGAMDAPRDKPAADPVFMALDGSQVAPGADVWFVGDARVDLECALNSGCTPVLIRPEAPLPGEFEGALPALYFDAPQGLSNFVKNL